MTIFTPQANDLRAVRTVLTVVSVGLGDPETIARALGKSHRQANYYIEAAVGLGLIEREKRGQLYERTDLGRRINWLGARNALHRIAGVAARTEIQQALARGHDDLVELIEAAGYSGSTVARRVSTAYAWAADIEELSPHRG